MGLTTRSGLILGTTLLFAAGVYTQGLERQEFCSVRDVELGFDTRSDRVRCGDGLLFWPEAWVETSIGAEPHLQRDVFVPYVSRATEQAWLAGEDLALETCVIVHLSQAEFAFRFPRIANEGPARDRDVSALVLDRSAKSPSVHTREIERDLAELGVEGALLVAFDAAPSGVLARTAGVLIVGLLLLAIGASSGTRSPRLPGPGADALGAESRNNIRAL